ncbi:transposase [Veillonella sp. VA142]|uniref:transposase n=1 Tax=Veillonella sp. VA142 TaxID=741834 RepID=UPI0021104744|nr:transposase [Veillonella sp. VA142]
MSGAPQIVKVFVLSYSNGFTEGGNNNIKVLKRISYGLRNFDYFRIRILLLSKKNSTSYLDS